LRFLRPITTFFILDFSFFNIPLSGGEVPFVSPAFGAYFLGGWTTTMIFYHFWSIVYMFTFTAFNFFLRHFHNSFNDFVYFDLDFLILFDSKIFSFIFFFYLCFYFIKSIFYVFIYNSNLIFFLFWILFFYFLFFFRNDLLFSDKSFKLNFNYILILKEYFLKTKSFKIFVSKNKSFKYIKRKKN
jgi:hypothetical protein